MILPFNSRPAMDPEDEGVHMNTATWTLMAVATVFLTLRIYCKLLRSRALLWWDDALVVAAWV